MKNAIERNQSVKALKEEKQLLARKTAINFVETEIEPILEKAEQKMYSSATITIPTNRTTRDYILQYLKDNDYIVTELSDFELLVSW